MIALSLTMLAGYGGMVSLAQLDGRGHRGLYASRFSAPTAPACSASTGPGELYVPVAILIAGIVSALIGLIAVRTAGIYTIMITLAIATAFFYFAQQNYSLFNGHSGFRGVRRPIVFGVDWRKPDSRSTISASRVAAAAYCAVVYCRAFDVRPRADGDPRQSAAQRALSATTSRLLRVAAFFFAGLIAGAAGVLYVWFNGRISPGTVGVGEVDQHPGHRRHRRPAPSDRAVPRRGALCAAEDLRHRPRRRRPLQHPDWRGLPRHRLRLADGLFGLWRRLAPRSGRQSPCANASGRRNRSTRSHSGTSKLGGNE